MNKTDKTISSDVIIIGGGVLGISLAYHLGKRNLKVIVLERESLLASHASAKNAGMIRQLYRNPQLTDWASRSIDNWPNELREISFLQTGSTIVGRTLPMHHNFLFEERIVESHPSCNICPAIFTKTDGLLNPHEYIQGLIRLSRDKHVSFRCSENIVFIEKKGAHWLIKTSDSSYKAPWVVIAAGAWINEILESSMPELQIAAFPYARHLFVVKGWPEKSLPGNFGGFYWDEIEKFYLRSWESNSRLVSICDLLPVLSPETFRASKTASDELAEKLCRYMPDIAANLSLAHSWHCFRTYVEDRLPVWGEDPSALGLFWLAAFGGFGMSCSFAATEDAAKYINGEAVTICKDFAPDRARKSSFPKLQRAIQ